jgi:hypothetical protein
MQTANSQEADIVISTTQKWDLQVGQHYASLMFCNGSYLDVCSLKNAGARYVDPIPIPSRPSLICPLHGAIPVRNRYERSVGMLHIVGSAHEVYERLIVE